MVEQKKSSSGVAFVVALVFVVILYAIISAHRNGQSNAQKAANYQAQQKCIASTEQPYMLDPSQFPANYGQQVLIKCEQEYPVQ